jgi:murein L,D-transpeptidase YcbB/YkuD
MTTMIVSALALGATVFAGGALSPNTPTAEAASYPNCVKTVFVTIRSGAATYGTDAPAASSGSINCILSNGNNSSAVTAVQKTMNLAANGSQGLKVDGIWGANTTAAMKRVQTRAGAKPVDGVYGPVTREKMVWQYNRVYVV